MQWFKMNLKLLLLLITLCAVPQCDVHACPHQCSCSGDKVECAGVSTMMTFPVYGLPRNTSELSILSTQISSIEASHLNAVPYLTRLQLYRNKLDKLPSNLLHNASRLNSLDLTGNQLGHLPPGVFSQKSLQNLVLKNNHIDQADVEWFADNNSLIWLDVSGNRLSEVPAAFLQKLKHLEHLDLSDNNLQELQPDALKNLHHLEILNLAGNKFTTLTPTAFNHNPKLSRLFLQENHLRELPPSLFSGLPRLQMLLLNQNRLQHIPQGLLDGRNSSFILTLATNPWLCDEKIEYLWRWINEHHHNVFYLEEVTCNGPEDLKDRQVVSLTKSELGVLK
ncbi:uncharacterized protein LOC144064477 [Stigmatopora argus]